jgi:alpha-D-ribose 1-methylphosphonate 5-triphosphate synthase subunit PhnI
MAYVAAKGGEQAIRAAEDLFRQLNGAPDSALIQQIERHMPYLIDRVIGESSLYAPQLAALAIAQTGGELYEAVLLLRAYRSTQPRLGYAEPIRPEEMLTIRRICAAFKDIPGGQILGPTLDYSHRLLRTALLDGAQGQDDRDEPGDAPQARRPPASPSLPTVASWQRAAGLVAPIPEVQQPDPADLPDVTRDPIDFPAPRAHRLQSLARADTGGVLALGYASMRGYGLIHPTVNEVRLAYADVRLRHPVSGAIFSAGRVRVSSCEVVSNSANALELGYSATLGWNEVKVIAASMLDLEMDKPLGHPAHTEEFVLSHTEPVEASGFCIHFKLPHYVTFASSLDALQRARAEAKPEEEGADVAR